MNIFELINPVRLLIEEAVSHYEKSAPTVAAYLDDLYVRLNERPHDVRVSELGAVASLKDDEGQWEQANCAANRFYKLASRLGRDTTGQAGY
jgi:hypothetical protein